MKNQIHSILVITLFIGLAFFPMIPGTDTDHTTAQMIYDEQNQSRSEFFFDLYIRTLMRIGNKPSVAAAIINEDEVVWSKAYGYYDIEHQKEALTETLYLQASVSKPVTATALMQLYDQGLFDLDDDVNDYLPFELRNPNHPDIPITIKMILSHRSSLAYDNLYWICLSYLPGDPNVEGYPYPWLKEYLVPGGSAYSSTTWSTAKPGEKYLYANIGFSVIAYLVEIISGQNFNEYCKEHIFEPLEMYTSGFRLSDHNIEDIAVPYEYKNNEFFRHPHYGIHVLHPSITLRTTINEFSNFIIAHMNGGVWNGVRILEESTVELMHTAHFSVRDHRNYGLGWALTNKILGKNEIGHSGGYVGVHVLVTIIPYDEIAVILFSNELDSELMSTRMQRRAFNGINDALFRKARRIAS